MLILSKAGANEPLDDSSQKTVDEVLELEFSKEFCEKIFVHHKPKKDVLYQAGVDTEGNALVPADINTFSIPIPKRLSIPIAIQKQLRLRPSRTIISNVIITQSETIEVIPEGYLKSPYVDEIPLGFLEYELESGKMTYNGKTFSSQQEAILRQKCQTVLEKSEN